jgi:hypothetical protein
MKWMPFFMHQLKFKLFICKNRLFITNFSQLVKYTPQYDRKNFEVSNFEMYNSASQFIIHIQVLQCQFTSGAQKESRSNLVDFFHYTL